jgi:hypothetical protein
MSDRTGIGLVELEILAALDALRAGSHATPSRCNKVIDLVDERIGLAPRHGYEVLCDLGRPWTVPLRLVEFEGDYGTRDAPPFSAGAAYTNARLSRVGELVLAAERGKLAAVPIGLINGNAYAAGTRPSFSPQGVLAAIRRVLEEPTIDDDTLLELIGPPQFPTGCTVTGEVSALASGSLSLLTLSAHIRIDAESRQLVIENIPPNVGPEFVIKSIENRRRRTVWEAVHPELAGSGRVTLAEVENLSTPDRDRIVCTAGADVDLGQLRDQLLAVNGVMTALVVQLPAPLCDLVRRFVDAHSGENLSASLLAVEGER